MFHHEENMSKTHNITDQFDQQNTWIIKFIVNLYFLQ